MGKFRKIVHSEVSRAARVLLLRYYRERGIKKSAKDIDRLVEAAELEIVPSIIKGIKSGSISSSS